MDGLLLDPEHPRSDLTEDLKQWLQTMHAECLAQLAVHDQGREALLADPSVFCALEELADRGMCKQSREHAAAALMALSEKELVVDTNHQRHVMLSYQWNFQATMIRIDTSLKRRGYLTWFDLTNSASRILTPLAVLRAAVSPAASLAHDAVKGSTIDAMSDAIEGAAVMLYGVSLCYKESVNVCSDVVAHVSSIGVALIRVPLSGYLTHVWTVTSVSALFSQCRLEGSYAHKIQLDMVPLMMQRDYTPEGWRKDQS